MIPFEDYQQLVKTCYSNKRVREELIKAFDEVAPDNYELWSYIAKSKGCGLLFMRHDRLLYVCKIATSRIKPDKNGRSKPIICDFCYTRLPGAKVSRISSEKTSDGHIVSWLVCSDMSCSLNVRELTPESIDSKRMLGENVSIDKKIDRLSRHIELFITTLELMPQEHKRA